MLAAMNLDKDIPVGNSDAGSFFNTEILASIDYGVRTPRYVLVPPLMNACSIAV